MIIPNDDLRTLCIDNDWFTCGTNRQYDKLFEANRMGANIDQITLIIWLCSDEIPMFKIKATLEQTEAKFI